MNKDTFEILTLLLEKEGQCSLNNIANELNISLETVESIVSNLTKEGLLLDNMVTASGIEALEPYRVKRAIFIAAGFGSRLVPITLNTPKPLVRVNDKRIIDTVLDAVVAAGIEEIIIVRGYLYEQFDQLLYKYPNIKFVENPMYTKANNISSIMCVRDFLKNAYVMEADLYLNNPKLIKKYQYTSNTLGIKVESSEDWCFVVKNGMILKQIPNGNEYKKNLKPDEELYQEVGISYLNEEAGIKLARHTEEVFSRPKGKNRYWDQVQFLDYCGQYEWNVRDCKKEDIVEIDSYQELVAIDDRYLVK